MIGKTQVLNLILCMNTCCILSQGVLLAVSSEKTSSVSMNTSFAKTGVSKYNLENDGLRVWSQNCVRRKHLQHFVTPSSKKLQGQRD